MGVVIVAVGLGGVFMWRLAEEHRAAAEGDGGAAGAFVVREARGGGPMSSGPHCYGVFRGGGVERRDVQAFGVPEAGCVRGKSYPARFARGHAVLAGAEEWKNERWGAFLLWGSVPVGTAVGIFALRARWKERRSAVSGPR